MQVVPSSNSWSETDGDVTIRPPGPDDVAVLVEGRDDAETRRWLPQPEEGSEPSPGPTACIVVDGGVVGWVAYDTERDWLRPGEVNIGYAVFAPHRRRGYASRALQLLLAHLARTGEYHFARASIDRGNGASIGVAVKAGFTLVDSDDNGVDYLRAIEPTD